MTRVSMQTIGERLLEARQRRGVSIREAAEATKVRGDYLTAMENNQFDTIPLADVYRRGFLKIYARFLRLDGERVVGDFNALLAARNPTAPRSRRATDIEAPVRGADGRESDVLDDFSSGAIEVATRPENRRKNILIAGVLFALLLPSKQAPAAGGEESAPDAQAAKSSEGEVIFTSQDTRPIVVSVKRHPDGVEVYSATIAPGASVTMRASGNLTLFASSKRLKFRVNGGGVMAVPPGYDSCQVTVPAKGR
jgi:cytoskeleton protein RodZ